MRDPAEFRVQVKLRNNRLLRLREDLGLSAADLAARAGVSYQKYVSLESLRSKPVDRKTGDWTPTARRIAGFHGVGLDWLWPETVRSITRRELAAVEVLYLSRPSTPEELASRAEQTTAVREAVRELYPSERRLLQLRASGETLEEAGQKMGVGRERLRTFEMRTLGKLREGLKRRGIK